MIARHKRQEISVVETEHFQIFALAQEAGVRRRAGKRDLVHRKGVVDRRTCGIVRFAQEACGHVGRADRVGAVAQRRR